MKKTVTLKITSVFNDKMAQFFDCGKPGTGLYKEAKALAEEGPSADVGSFISEQFGDPSVELFVHSIPDGTIQVCVEDEDGEEVFKDEEFDGICYGDYIKIDPRKFEFDESMGETLTNRIKKYIAQSSDGIDGAIAELEDAGESEFLTDLGAGIAELVCQAPFVEAGYDIDSFYMKTGKNSPPLFFAVKCAELECGYGLMSCKINLEDGEEFDSSKLKLIVSDYDGFYCSCDDAVLPVVLYGNRFYRLVRDDWDINTEYNGFAEKEKGGTYLEFAEEFFSEDEDEDEEEDC